MSFTGDGGAETVLQVATATVYEFYDDATGTSRTDYGSPVPQTVLTSFKLRMHAAGVRDILRACLTDAPATRSRIATSSSAKSVAVEWARCMPRSTRASVGASH